MENRAAAYSTVLSGNRPRPFARCAACALPEEFCICSEVPRLSVRTRTVIVMHHTERRKASNTGRLAALALSGAEIRMRGMATVESRAPLPEGRRLLLFPGPNARVLDREEHAGADVVLMVPDGNWGQAFRAARRDPDLVGAEPVVLPPGPPTRYALRRGTEPGRVCTLEAIARAFGILEGPEVQLALEALLELFVARTLRFAGNKAAMYRLGHLVEGQVATEGDDDA